METDARTRGGRRRRKLSEIVADRIVTDIIRRGWKEGEVLGTEADFLDHFRISRATFREAVRQLEWSGVAGMRRGLYGGLVVKSPPRRAIVLALKTYFELTHLERGLLDETAATLRGAPQLRAGPAPNRAIELFLEALDTRTIADMAEEAATGGAGPKLSETVALNIVRDIERAGIRPGENMGNETDLQRHYRVSRAVLREALRSLELHDVVRIRTGSQGGIIMHHCDPEYTIALTSTYLSFARIPLTHLWEAQSCLKMAAVRTFVARSDSAALGALERALARLEQASTNHYLLAASEFHMLIAQNSGNRVAALFMGVLQRYGVSALPRPDEAFLPALKEQHRDLLEAARCGDAEAASAQMLGMYDHSRRWIARIERDRERSEAAAG